MSLKHWIAATRPKTLPAGAIPVIIGSSFAYKFGQFDWFYFAIILICAIFIQILVNFINEIYDHKKGADTEERLGPKRAVASGLISPKAMTTVSVILMIITFALGMILVAKAGYVILAIGILSLFFSWAYTGGPYPLAYNGLGDIFVLVFFGIAATTGTFYVFTEFINAEIIIASLAPGFISMNLLGVNNIRDIDTDIKAGKMTLQAKIGKEGAKKLHLTITVWTYLLPIVLTIATNNAFMLLPLVSFPVAWKNQKQLNKFTGKDLNIILANTGKLLIIYGLLLSAGALLGT